MRPTPTKSVASALSSEQPVVALESTVITHGLPRPRNLELARDLETQVERGGAVPATVGIIGGEPLIGLGGEQLARLASGDARKVSLWNLAAVVASGADGGTTVAATLALAAAAGIEVFATGGIGGVHPQPFDESADLTALARFPVITVCSGPKSILLAEATLERLETLGVPVVGYRSDRLAGFLTRETDLPLPARADDPDSVARIFLAQRRLGLTGGLLVSNPVATGIDAAKLASWRAEAEAEAAAARLSGGETTPFLLRRLAELSEGATVDVNLRLLRENARLAAEIAVALSRTRSTRQARSTA